ncbi:TPA: hypothetical protein MG551_19730 [Klebsiella aerogenes]|nr:hypothetical protein [Klebsiella aerogenes]
MNTTTQCIAISWGKKPEKLFFAATGRRSPPGWRSSSPNQTVSRVAAGALPGLLPLVISKSPVALPLTGATALCDLVARLSAAQAGEIPGLRRLIVRSRSADAPGSYRPDHRCWR